MLPPRAGRAAEHERHCRGRCTSLIRGAHRVHTVFNPWCTSSTFVFQLEIGYNPWCTSSTPRPSRPIGLIFCCCDSLPEAITRPPHDARESQNHITPL
eukprot:11060977-Heterocapsa_arctica.AAC.1